MEVGILRFEALETKKKVALKKKRKRNEWSGKPDRHVTVAGRSLIK